MIELVFATVHQMAPLDLSPIIVSPTLADRGFPSIHQAVERGTHRHLRAENLLDLAFDALAQLLTITHRLAVRGGLLLRERRTGHLDDASRGQDTAHHLDDSVDDDAQAVHHHVYVGVGGAAVFPLLLRRPILGRESGRRHGLIRHHLAVIGELFIEGMFRGRCPGLTKSGETVIVAQPLLVAVAEQTRRLDGDR